MGLVLAFESAPRQAPRTPQRSSEPTQSADILFFTGVRYERNSADAPEAASCQPDVPETVTPAS